MEPDLCDRLREVCAAAEPRLPTGPARDAVHAVRERLADRRLRLAVGGRLNAGKSTLVNALLGQRLAMTDATECTKVVAWFGYGVQARVVVHPVDGEPYALAPAAGGGLPADLRRPAGRIRHVTVESSNAALRTQPIVIDTPGLDSLTKLDDYSLEAIRQADALLYVMPHPGQGDAAALAAFRSDARDSGVTAGNAIGVLSRIDQLTEGDPWRAADRLARRYRSTLRALVSEVIPVAGLLAQTACGELFTEGDTQALRLLAQVRDREAMLYSPDTVRAFTATPVDAAARGRLVELLGVYGIREALTLVDAGVTGTVGLLDGLRVRSGIDALTTVIRERITGAADRLRARRALALLDSATWSGADADERRVLAGLRAELTAVRRDPRLRLADLADILSEVGDDRLRLDPDREDELVDLVTGKDVAARLGAPAGTPTAQLMVMTDQRIAAWRTLEGSPTRALARHARAVREALEDVFFELEETGRG